MRIVAAVGANLRLKKGGGTSFPLGGRFVVVPPTPAAPTISQVVLTGGSTVGSTVSANIVYSQHPYPAAQVTYQWVKDEEDIEGANNKNYTLQSSDSDSLIFCRVFSSNVQGSSEVNSNTISVKFTAPTISNVTVSPLNGRNGDVFEAIFTFTGEGLTFSYQWKEDGEEVEGATSPTYTPSNTEEIELSCVVTITNNGGEVSAESSPSASVSYFQTPSLLLYSITPSTGEIGTTFILLVTANGVPVPAITQQWKLNGVNIGEATGSSYLSTEIGSLTCTVVATNSEGSDTKTTTAVTVTGVAPDLPTIDGVPNQDYTPSTGVQTLDLSDHATGDNLTYSYIQTTGLTSLSALVVEEGVGGTKATSTAFPFSSAGLSYALTGPSPTFTVGSDPRGGITDDDLPTGISINTSSGLITISENALSSAEATFTVWKYNEAVVASQTISITITDTPDDVWDVTYGTETITVVQKPTISSPTSNYGVETVIRTA